MYPWVCLGLHALGLFGCGSENAAFHEGRAKYMQIVISTKEQDFRSSEIVEWKVAKGVCSPAKGLART